MINLREPYIYLMALIYRLYGEKDCSKFSEKWIPLAYTMEIIGRSFKLGPIISKKLSIGVHQAHTSKEGEAPTFYLASYLLNVMCARNVSVGMNLRWNVAELMVHIYFNILCENMYKTSYALICNEFITCIHFIIFKKECPRLSAEAKKIITNIGHWYLYECSTYIRVSRSTIAPHILPAHVPYQLVVG
jgi:hypothetical protein